MAAVTRALGVLLLWPTLVCAQPAPPATVSASLSSTTCPGTGCVTLNVSSYASVGVQVTGTWVGTLTFQASNDGVTYQTLNATATNGTSPVTTTTANGLWSSSAAGLKYVQVVFTAYTSGTAVVTLQAALAGGGSGGGGSGGSDVTVHDPTVTTQKAAVNASGQLSVNCANCSGSGVSQQDNTGFTPGTTNMVPIGAEVDDVATTAATENNAAAVRMDTNRSLYVQLRSGAAQTGTSGSPVRTDPTGTTTQPETPKDSGGTSMTDTTAHALKVLSVDATGTVIAPTTLATHDGALTPASTTGGLSMYRASSSAPTAVSTNDDAVLPWADLTGRLHVTGDSAMTALKVDGSGVTQPVSGTVTTTPPTNATTNVTQYASTNVVSAGVAGLFAVGGAAASGATKSGNPIQIGGVFNTTQPTVTTGQAVEAQATARGELLIAKGVSGFSIDNTAFTANAGTNLNTSALALDTSVNGLLLSQGSTTSGQKGPLAQGAVTTNAPTYTTGQTSPLSLDAAGLLRASLKDTPSNTNNLNVNLAASGATVTVTGTVTTTPPTNASTNVAQFGGVNVSTGTGASGTGIPRVTVANDSTLTSVGSITNTVGVQGTLTNNNAAPSTNHVATLSARATADLPVYTEGNEVLRSTDLSGNTRVGLSSPNGPVGTRSNPLVTTTLPGLPLSRTLVTTTQLVSPLGAPLGTPQSPLSVAPVNTSGCAGQSPQQTASAAINQASATTTKVISGSTTLTTYICAVDVVVAGADNVAAIYGSGATCATGTTGLAGGTTAATGWNFAANGGLTKGNGQGVVWKVPPGNDVCIATSAAVQASGSFTFTQF